jgi:hypothetical protein
MIGFARRPGTAVEPTCSTTTAVPPRVTGTLYSFSRGHRGARQRTFPVCNEDSVGSLYTDEFEVVYVCELIEGLGYSWRSLGPAVEPPREG